MNGGVFIENIELGDLVRIIQLAVVEETGPVREELEELREELRRHTNVMTPKRATWYFDEYVTPETIIGYIKHRGLPAFKNGRKWFIYRGDLEDWQIGKIGWEASKEINIVVPRYQLQSRPVRSHIGDRRPLSTSRP